MMDADKRMKCLETFKNGSFVIETTDKSERIMPSEGIDAVLLLQGIELTAREKEDAAAYILGSYPSCKELIKTLRYASYLQPLLRPEKWLPEEAEHVNAMRAEARQLACEIFSDGGSIDDMLHVKDLVDRQAALALKNSKRIDPQYIAYHGSAV